MSAKIKINRNNYFIKAMALPLLSVILCAFGLNVNTHANVAILQPLIKHDTIPASEISKIKGEDVESIVVNKMVVILKLKNGDSVITRRNDFDSVAAKDHNAMSATSYDKTFTKSAKDSMPSGYDKTLTIKADTPPNYDKTFSKLEVEASYPGGPAGWMQYLNKNFKYPIEAMEKGVQGTVIVQFIVDTEGNVSNVEAISGPTRGGLREEAIRIVKNSGKWVPGKQNGIDVRSYKKQPLTFVLQSK